MDTLTIPKGTRECPPEDHTWTTDVYVPADVARVCSTCGRVEFAPYD